MIESFYDRWYATWAPAIGEGECKHVTICYAKRLANE